MGVVGARPVVDVVVRRTVLAAAFGLVVTGLLLTPYLPFGVMSRAGHLTLNALDTFIALLVAFLLHIRFLRSGRLQDLLLSQGMVMLGLAGLGLTYAADVLPGVRPGTLDVWLPLSVRMLGALLIAAAAIGGERCLPVRWRHGYLFVPALVVVVSLLVLLAVRSSDLPVALEFRDVPSSAARPVVAGHVLLLAAQGLAASCFVLAAVVFTVRGASRQDELLRWLGPACVLAAFARVHYLLFPSLYTDWLYTGDLLRTASYLLLLVGAAREIHQYWVSQSEVAVLEDRRRLARELHDGVIQEVGYIRAETLGLPGSVGQTRIVNACDRALNEARTIVHVLGSDSEEPLAASIGRAVTQIAEQYDVGLHFALDRQLEATSEQRHALVRIAREAVANAARHGKASEVRVTLDGRDAVHRLSMADDGRGFDVEEASSRGTTYGLTSMRDRARGLPGQLQIESSPGAGTVVEVTW